jgi:hypothetical protein
VTRLRATPAEIPGRVLHQWSQDIDPTNELACLLALQEEAKRVHIPKAWGRLAVEAWKERAGWVRYEQP